MATGKPQIRSRKPTGQVPYPLVLLEGDEKAGKSYQLAVLSASDLVGTCYWIDLGEGSADEYGAIPGANYDVIQHDGSYAGIVDQITAVYWEAKRAADAGEPPVVLGVDTMTALWRMLTNWTNDRAKRSRNGQKILKDDPDAEVSPTSNLWNDANGRHRRVLDLLQSFPGIVVMTARGKEVAEMGANGQPIEGKKVWKVEGQKELAFEASVWVRMFRSPRRAQLIGGRGLQLGQMDGKPVDLPDFTLEELIFERLGLPKNPKVRDLPLLHGDEMVGLVDAVQACLDEASLKELYEAKKQRLTPDQREDFTASVTARLQTIREAPEDNFTPPADEPPAEAPEVSTDAQKVSKAAKNKTPKAKPKAKPEPKSEPEPEPAPNPWPEPAKIGDPK